jgi:hypothetical protein
MWGEPKSPALRLPNRATARRLAASIGHRAPSVCRAKWQWPAPFTLRHYPSSTLLRSSPPLAGASVLSASRFEPLVLFPSHVPYNRLGSLSVSPRLIPEVGSAPGFDIIQSAFTSSAVRLRSPLSTLPAGILRWRKFRGAGRDRPTSFHSPWQNGYVERLIGSIRRECTDLIVLSAEHLRRILAKYASYYNEVRDSRFAWEGRATHACDRAVRRDCHATDPWRARI